MKLNINLQKVNEDFVKNAPSDILALLKTHIETLVLSNIEQNALKEGDSIPPFTLNNAYGEPIDIYSLLNDGPMIISFYRGAWCPYCNLELQGYQEIIEDIRDASGQLVGISPELPDNSLSLVERYALKYDVLSDLDNQVVDAFGLSYFVDSTLKEAYDLLGIDLVKSQGEKQFKLPIPATYLVDMEGRIAYSYINVDYTKRLEPEDALNMLRKLG